MAMVKCEAFTCTSNRQGECQAGSISLADKEYYNEIGEPAADDLCCECFKWNREWRKENPLPEGVKWKY